MKKIIPAHPDYHPELSIYEPGAVPADFVQLSFPRPHRTESGVLIMGQRSEDVETILVYLLSRVSGENAYYELSKTIQL